MEVISGLGRGIHLRMSAKGGGLFHDRETTYAQERIQLQSQDVSMTHSSVFEQCSEQFLGV